MIGWKFQARNENRLQIRRTKDCHKWRMIEQKSLVGAVQSTLYSIKLPWHSIPSRFETKTRQDFLWDTSEWNWRPYASKNRDILFEAHIFLIPFTFATFCWDKGVNVQDFGKGSLRQRIFWSRSRNAIYAMNQPSTAAMFISMSIVRRVGKILRNLSGRDAMR